MLNLSFRSLRAQTLAFCCSTVTIWTTPPALCHEFWIEPEKYQVFSGTSFSAGLRNGQMFQGARLPYLPERIARFDIVQNGQITAYRGRMGDMPALLLDDLQPGLLIALHETTTDDITYDTLENFAEFGREKGNSDLTQWHQARGLSEKDITEHYSRHTKLLVGVGHGLGSDRSFGLETEFVALTNPYETSKDFLPVQLLYLGAPQPMTQVEVFERDPDDMVRSFVLRSDKTGRLSVPVQSGHRYLLNAVIFRPAPPTSAAVWETLWASMVFAMP